MKVDLIITIGVFADLIRGNLIHTDSGSAFCIPDFITLSSFFQLSSLVPNLHSNKKNHFILICAYTILLKTLFDQKTQSSLIWFSQYHGKSQSWLYGIY
jgi:hypothetical protein